MFFRWMDDESYLALVNFTIQFVIILLRPLKMANAFIRVPDFLFSEGVHESSYIVPRVVKL